jgi:hypothetical protein
MKPHPHAVLIKAWADGAQIQQYRENLDEWRDCSPYPVWDERLTYRIKPELQPDIVKAFMLESHPLGGLRFYDATGFSREKDEQRILVTFDGETGELKSAEVLR